MTDDIFSNLALLNARFLFSFKSKFTEFNGRMFERIAKFNDN